MWSVAQTKPNQLGLALTNLARQGFHTFNPGIERRKLDRRHKPIVVNEALFLNYVFIELLDGQRWPPINSTYGVNKLLTRKATGSEYFEPAIIADSFINDLMQCSTQKDERDWRLDPGTKVRIERGPFAQMTGTIASWSSAERCRMLVWMLGRETAVEVHPADIVAVA